MADETAETDVKEETPSPEELLKAAIKGDTDLPDKSTVDETVKTEAKEETKAAPENIPYSRFKEVNDQLKTLKEEFDEATTKSSADLQAAHESLTELADIVQASKEDAELVSALRGLSHNPKHTDLIAQVDKALAGIEEAEEAGEATTEEATKARQEVSQVVQDELRDEIAEQREELLMQRTDGLAKEYLDQLPEEITEQDKELVSELWASRLDWDSCVQDPTQVPELLRDSLVQTLEDYGDPKGKVALAEETEEAATTEESEPSLADRMGKYLAPEWGALKTDSEGNVSPEVSDEDFSKGLGNLWKLGNRQ